VQLQVTVIIKNQ